MEARLRKLENVTVTITVSHEFHIRMWLGLQLMQLGARVTGARVVVERGNVAGPS